MREVVVQVVAFMDDGVREHVFDARYLPQAAFRVCHHVLAEELDPGLVPKPAGHCRDVRHVLVREDEDELGTIGTVEEVDYLHSNWLDRVVAGDVVEELGKPGVGEDTGVVGWWTELRWGGGHGRCSQCWCPVICGRFDRCGDRATE